MKSFQKLTIEDRVKIIFVGLATSTLAFIGIYFAVVHGVNADIPTI